MGRNLLAILDPNQGALHLFIYCWRGNLVGECMKKIVLGTMMALTLSAPAFAAEDFRAGDFMLRARAVGVAPDENGTVSNGAKTNIDNHVVPELDLTYFINPNVAVELIAAVSPHNVTTNTGVDAGDVWLLPPTLTLQYHFTQFDGVKPYVGAGVNYTHFFNADGGALTNVDYDDSFGAALQAGVDVPIGDNLYFNADVKKIFISTDATFRPSGLTADVDIDPWFIGMGALATSSSHV
jgi:outer membrane protein